MPLSGLGRGVENFLKNFEMQLIPALKASSVLGKTGFSQVPPPLRPSESRDWRGICKDAWQNLEPQGVRGQNLDKTGLAPLFRAAYLMPLAPWT